MAKIFLAPRSNETSYKNFLSTIENGIEYSIIEPFLSGEGKKLLSGRGKLFIWGNRETKKSSWDKMEVDDLILFYKGKQAAEKEGKFVYAGRLLYKQHSRDLGLALWPPKPGEEPWTCIFILRDLQPIYIPVSDIAAMGRYKPAFVVQGFMPLSQIGVNSIFEKFGTVDKLLYHYAVKEKGETSDLETSREDLAHAESQLYLLKIGRTLGYDTYCPNSSSQVAGEHLKDCTTLKQVPARFIGGELIKLVKEIDVIWFKDEVPKFAFEVERTTKFGSGFQRLVQLNPLGTKLFIISSSNNRHLFEKYIHVDPFYKTKGSFRFKTYSELESYFKAVSEFDKLRETFEK